MTAVPGAAHSDSHSAHVLLSNFRDQLETSCSWLFLKKHKERNILSSFFYFQTNFEIWIKFEILTRIRFRAKNRHQKKFDFQIFFWICRKPYTHRWKRWLRDSDFDLNVNFLSSFANSRFRKYLSIDEKLFESKRYSFASWRFILTSDPISWLFFKVAIGADDGLDFTHHEQFFSGLSKQWKE